jgi:hypothetical protein
MTEITNGQLALVLIGRYGKDTHDPAECDVCNERWKEAQRFNMQQEKRRQVEAVKNGNRKRKPGKW